MPTTKNPGRPVDDEDTLPVTDIFSVLSNERRLQTVQYLSQLVGAVETKDIADHLALVEGNHTSEHFERISTGLVHVHIPALVDAGIAEYDPERETVALLDVAEEMQPYLALASKSVDQ